VILLELLLFIAVGAVSFIVSRIMDFFGEKFPASRRPPRVRLRHRGDIETDLDMTFLAYKQGLLNEEQYLDQTDELIDQLADLLY
jgi:hypothetical protein